MAALADVKAPPPIKEIIGRTPPLINIVPRMLRATGESNDSTRTDYAWWDKTRNGRKHGFELSGLFLKPIAQITSSWVWGDGADIELVGTVAGNEANAEHTDEQLDGFVRDNLSRLLQMTTDLYGLGDQYVIINADGTLSIPSPDTVEVKRDPLDYRKIVSVTVCATYTNATVHDTYTDALRVVIIKNLSAKETLITRFGEILPNQTAVFEFDNLIGVIPVVHFACDRSADETNGRPLADALVRLLSRYDDLLEKALDGSETLSDPVPVMICEPGTVDEMITLNTRETGEEDSDGNAIRQMDLNWLKSIFTTRDFKFAAPGSFTADIEKMLQMLFLLLLEHTRIPETVWGGEMGQSRSSTQEQMDTFKQYIKERRLQLEGMRDGTSDGLLLLFKLWLMTKALTDRQIIISDVTVRWQELSRKDEALQFQKVQYAHGTGNLTDETMIDLLDLVEDPATEVEAAHAESAARADTFDAAMQGDNQDDSGDMADTELDNAA